MFQMRDEHSKVMTAGTVKGKCFGRNAKDTEGFKVKRNSLVGCDSINYPSAS